METIESSVKLTSKNQTTIPIAVRKALNLGPEDHLTFLIEDGQVRVVRAEEPGEDSVVIAFLKFLEQDMTQNPSKLSVLQRDEDLARRLKKVQFDPSWD